MPITVLPTREFELANGALLGIPWSSSDGWVSDVGLGGKGGQVRLRWDR
jgi:hypothetical protein